MAQILPLVEKVEEKAVKILNEANIEKEHLKEESTQRLKDYALKVKDETAKEIEDYQRKMEQEVSEKLKQLDEKYEINQAELKKKFQKNKDDYISQLVKQVIGE